MAKAKKSSPGDEEPDPFDWTDDATGNDIPWPEKKKHTVFDLMRMLKYVQGEVATVVLDHARYLIITIGKNELFYSINEHCPEETYEQIEQLLRNKAEQLEVDIITKEMKD